VSSILTLGTRESKKYGCKMLRRVTILEPPEKL
jgi:hypothetical protein